MLARVLICYSTRGTALHHRIDGRQRHVVGHLACYLVHVEVFRINLLHLLDHLVGDAEQRGVNHIVLPQLHLFQFALVEQCKLLQELPQSEHLTYLVFAIFVMRQLGLLVQGVDKRVDDALVQTALHILLQFLGLQHGVATCCLLKDVVYLA